jgi:drug/metabolite transporter (DMT)-like permease
MAPGLAPLLRATVLGMAIFSTVLPIVLMSVGIRLVGSSRAAMLSAFGPVATMGLGYLFLGEALSAAQLVGAGLVVAGVMAITRAKAG